MDPTSWIGGKTLAASEADDESLEWEMCECESEKTGLFSVFTTVQKFLAAKGFDSCFPAAVYSFFLGSTAVWAYLLEQLVINPYDAWKSTKNIYKIYMKL